MLFFIKGNLKEFKFGRFCSIIFFERNITAITNVKKCTFAFMNSEFGKYLEKFNITSLNKMQEETIEAINNNKDTLVLSPTGSGKTLAFLLPLLKLAKKNLEQTQVLILTPTRELTIQVEKVFKQMQTGMKINSSYGGHSVQVEKNNFINPPIVLVGTPGRILDHINRKSFNWDCINTLIIDEFDKCLELGFTEEMVKIIRRLDLNKTILTSATDIYKLPKFTKIKDPVRIDYLNESSETPELSNLDVRAVYSPEKDKLETLYDLLQDIGNESTIVFCNRKDGINRIYDFLEAQNIVSTTFHGDLEQEEREKSIIKFRNGSSNILLATDLASRGLDIDDIKNVVHYHLPHEENVFIHRNGRTARMQKEGTAYVIFAPDEKVSFRKVFSAEEYKVLGVENYVHPEYVTLYINKGKKDKVNKIDIVGFFYKQIELEKDELGLIDIKDFSAYVAVKRTRINEIVEKANKNKIKNKTVKVQVAS
tara:strand:- start:4287 stop:5726 length:1440 start_codon:yes stop_codon:yes gene_type:complete